MWFPESRKLFTEMNVLRTSQRIKGDISSFRGKGWSKTKQKSSKEGEGKNLRVCRRSPRFSHTHLIPSRGWVGERDGSLFRSG